MEERNLAVVRYSLLKGIQLKGASKKIANLASVHVDREQLPQDTDG